MWLYLFSNAQCTPCFSHIWATQTVHIAGGTNNWYPNDPRKLTGIFVMAHRKFTASLHLGDEHLVKGLNPYPWSCEEQVSPIQLLSYGSQPNVNIIGALLTIDSASENFISCFVINISSFFLQLSDWTQNGGFSSMYVLLYQARYPISPANAMYRSAPLAVLLYLALHAKYIAIVASAKHTLIESS